MMPLTDEERRTRRSKADSADDVEVKIKAVVTNMPPGYALQYNNDTDEYRPVYAETGTPLFTTTEMNTRQKAVDRAWGQWRYEDDQKNIQDGWVAVQ